MHTLNLVALLFFFMASCSGHTISEWGETIGNQETLPQTEIRKLLQRDK
jgi:hypothetical protein